MQDINLFDLAKQYLRYWLLIALFSLAGLVAGITYNNFVQTPMYKSYSTLILVDSDQITLPKGSNVINNYIELLKSRRVLEPVIASQYLGQSYEQLAGSISASNDKDTEVVKVSISTKSPQTSKHAVDGAIKSFKAEVKRLYGKDNIKVVDAASTPIEPYNVHKPLQLIMFTIAGFLISLIIIFFIYDFNLNRPKAKKSSKPARRKTTSRSTASVKRPNSTKKSRKKI